MRLVIPVGVSPGPFQ